MIKYISLVLGVLLLLTGFALQAEETIGVVDWRRALFQSNSAKKVDKQMKADHKEDLERIKELEGKVESTRKKLAKDKDLLSDSELKTLEKDFQQDFAEFNMLRNRLQEVQIATESRFVANQRARIDKAMEQLAKKHKLTIVLDRSVVVYGKTTMELTQELTDVLNSAK